MSMALGLAVPLLAWVPAQAASQPSPSLGANAAAAPGSANRVEVIVVLSPSADVDGVASSVARQSGGTVGHRYRTALRGFSITVPQAALAGIAHRRDVAFVEPSRTVSVDAQSTPTGIRRTFAEANPALGIDGADDQRVDVDVAIIDTGIDLQQPDLNVVGGVNCVNTSAVCVSGGDDDHYHGTHVAGSVGALDNGIGVVGMAPGARLWAVKVLNSQGSGSTAQVVAGIDWVAAHADTIEVANMSLGGAGYSNAEYNAIQGAVNRGVAFAVAAGNSGADASGYSPAAFNNVLTVSALADFDGLAGGLGASTCRADVDDTNADFSNYGSVVDIAAPGVCITSTYPIEKGSLGTISGTSMASPHAAGALALLASRSRATNASGVQALYNALTSAGNQNWSDQSPDGVREPLLDVSTFSPVLVPVVAPPPPSAITYAGSATSLGRNGWRATVTATAAAGTTVSGQWSAGSSATNGCTVPVGATSCTFSADQSKRTSSATWTSSGGIAVVIAKP